MIYVSTTLNWMLSVCLVTLATHFLASLRLNQSKLHPLWYVNFITISLIGCEISDGFMVLFVTLFYRPHT